MCVGNTVAMPAQERLATIGLRRTDAFVARIGREARELRLGAGISQAQLGLAIGASRQWIARFELGRLRNVD
jgi:hypothetical protein